MGARTQAPSPRRGSGRTAARARRRTPRPRERRRAPTRACAGATSAAPRTQSPANSVARSEPSTSPRTTRKSPSGQIPSASPGNTGEERRPLEPWTSSILSMKSRAGPITISASATSAKAPPMRSPRCSLAAALARERSIVPFPKPTVRIAQTGIATANQTPPGIEKVNTDAAARTAITPTTARAGGASRSSSFRLSARWRTMASATTSIAITVSLKPDWARNDAPRYGRPVRPAARPRRHGGRPPRSDRAASAVRAGIATSRPLKVSTRLTVVPSDTLAASACGPTG